MKDIMISGTDVVLVENDVSIAEFDKRVVIDFILNNWEKILDYQALQTWEDRRNGFSL